LYASEPGFSNNASTTPRTWLDRCVREIMNRFRKGSHPSIKDVHFCGRCYLKADIPTRKMNPVAHQHQQQSCSLSHRPCSRIKRLLYLYNNIVNLCLYTRTWVLPYSRISRAQWLSACVSVLRTPCWKSDGWKNEWERERVREREDFM